MLQIRAIRTYTPRGSQHQEEYDTNLIAGKEYLFADISKLLENINVTLADIPEQERYNLHVTQGHIEEGESEQDRQSKIWKSQDIILYDIDDIEINEDGNYDKRYHEAIFKALEISQEQQQNIPISFTGGGIQLIIQLKEPITSQKFFQQYRKYYNLTCDRINDTLAEYGLKGKADTAVFAPNKMFRLPLTKNVKPNRTSFVKLLNSHIEPIDFKLQKAAGVPELDHTDFMDEKQLSYINIDSDYVESECLFLKEVKKHEGNVSEPAWYAALSIVGRLDNGKELAHLYSKGHPTYSPRQTEKKLEQAMKAAGPRTCDNIDTIFGRCRECPHYKKVTSPICLKGEEFIATDHSGFHVADKKGKLIPQYEDLRKFYHKTNPYLNANKSHYVWKDNHWHELADVWIDNFAQEHFNPKPKNTMVNEFRGLVLRTNLKPNEFFRDTTNRLINTANGVLNIDTLELMPHSPMYGFKYIANFEYDPQATCPMFDQFMHDITLGDQSMQRVMLEFMGYAISNDLPLAQKALLLTGEGSNGKSTFIQILKALGGDGVTALGVRELTNQFYRQSLDGAAMNIMEELPSFTNKEFWEDFKDLVTGGQVAASKKFKDVYTFNNKAKFILTCNALPSGANPNHGYFRRLIIIPFNAKFDQNNAKKDIAQQIIANELSGVINKVLDAYKRLKINNYQFTDCKAASATLAQYKRDIDSVARWCQDHITIAKPDQDNRPSWVMDSENYGLVASIPEMRVEYEQWCQTEGEKPCGARAFSDRLLRWVREQKNVEFYSHVSDDLLSIAKNAMGTMCTEYATKTVVLHVKVMLDRVRFSALTNVTWR